MEALIIAAGQGSRLKNKHSPKPLVKLFGLTLLERQILTAREAGIRHFKIVVGYQAEKIMNFLGAGEKYGVHIEYIYNPEWQKGNGVSVYCARNYFREPFLLMMSDHITEPGLIKKLLTVRALNGESFLAVDRNLAGDHYQPDDVTKVLVEEAAVQFIGKNLGHYNALDTGFFVYSPAIFSALEQSIASGDYSLSAGNQILANQGLLQVIDVTGHFWIDVDDAPALKKARRLLLRRLVKETDGPVSRFLNRKLSIPLSARLADYRVTPNHMTVVSFLVAVAAGFLFGLGGSVAVVLAGGLTQFSSVLDGCDGEIARLTFQKSFFGEWLDRVLDRLADGIILLGMTFGIWQNGASPWIWLLGGLAIISTLVSSYTALPYDRLVQEKVLSVKRQFRLGRDVRLLLIFIAALVHQLLAALWILTVLMSSEIVRRLISFRQLEASALQQQNESVLRELSRASLAAFSPLSKQNQLEMSR